MQQLTTQGITGRHQPRQAAAAGRRGGEDGEPPLDPRYAPAQDALERDDFDGAVAEYQKLLDANPADTEAAAGLAMATLLQRTKDADLDAAREAAAARAPTTSPPRPWSPTSTCSAATSTTPSTGWSTWYAAPSGDDRNQAREHLLGLFAAVGNDDPRVLKGRQALASACSDVSRRRQRATGTQSTGRLARCSSLCGVEPSIGAADRALAGGADHDDRGVVLVADLDQRLGRLGVDELARAP